MGDNGTMKMKQVCQDRITQQAGSPLQKQENKGSKRLRTDGGEVHRVDTRTNKSKNRRTKRRSEPLSRRGGKLKSAHHRGSQRLIPGSDTVTSH